MSDGIKTGLTEHEKRELIYSGMRLRKIDDERAHLLEAQKEIEKLTQLDEENKRYRIYITERLSRLANERKQTVAVIAKLQQ